MKNCPFCDERIADNRAICPYCNNEGKSDFESEKNFNENEEEKSITNNINEAMHKYFPSKPISPIFLSSLIQAYGLDFNSDGKFKIKNSNQLANGKYKTYHHRFGLIQTKDVSTVGEFENGEMKKITEYDKYGNVVNCWEQGYNLGDTDEKNDDAHRPTDWDDIV